MNHLPALYLESAFLLSFFLFSPSLSQEFGNCPMITISDLGRTRDISSDGLAAGIVGASILIQNSSILCLSSGTQRSTYRSASVLIQYRCSCNNQINIHQFAFICNVSGEWTSNPVSSINREPKATFGMETETRCSFCSPLLGTSISSSYCIACNTSCSGAGLCYGEPTGGGTCCNYYTVSDECTSGCSRGLVPRASDFRCVTPTFTINNNSYAAPISGSAVYVHDPNRGSKLPFDIICPLTVGPVTWFYESPLGSARGAVVENSEPLFAEGVTVVSLMGSRLSLSDVFDNVSLLACVSAGEEFALRIATDNPYLAVSGSTRRFVLPGTFTIRLTIAYTLVAGLTETPRNDQDVAVMVVNDGGIVTEGSSVDVGAILRRPNPFRWNYLFNTSQLSSSVMIMFVVRPGSDLSAMSPLIEVYVTDLPILPAVFILHEGANLFFNCTPTAIDPQMPFSITLNGNIISTLATFVNKTVTSNIAGRYMCRLGSSVQRTSDVVVLPNSNTDGLFLTDYNFVFVANEHVINIVNKESLMVHCFGRSGNGQLEWFVESTPGNPRNELRENLQAIAGKIGEFNFIVRELQYTVEYVVTSNPTVHHTWIQVSPNGVRDSFVDYLKCHSRESGLSRYVTVTNYFVFIDNYRTNLNPVLGQMLNIRYRVAISGGVIMSPPVLLFNQISPINGESLVQNTENAQLYEVMIDVVTDMNNGAYTLRLFVFERMEMLNTNITVAIPSLSVSSVTTVVRERESFMVDCIPSNDLVQIDWFILEPNPEREGSVIPRLLVRPEYPEYTFTPPLRQHRMKVQSASARTRGEFICAVRGSLMSISQPFAIQVLLLCPVSVAAGIRWESAFFGDVQTVPCVWIDPSFSGSYKETCGKCNVVTASRACGDNGLWSHIDFSGCTLRSTQEPFLLLWLVVDVSRSVNESKLSAITDEITSNVAFYGSMPLSNNNERVFPYSASLTLVRYDIQYEDMDGIPAVGVQILYRASLNFTGSQVNVSAIRSMFVRTEDFIGDLAVVRQTQHSAGVIGFQASDDCECFPYQFETVIPNRVPRQTAPPVMYTGGLSSLHQLCVGLSISPCDCSAGNDVILNSGSGAAPQSRIFGGPCECNFFFVGNGQRCVLDRDDDGFPDQPLSTCANLNQLQEPPTFCIKDSCPTIYNIPQSNTAICTSGDCPMEVDSVFGLVWGFASADTTVIQLCGPGYIGTVSRTCWANKTWGEPDVSQCLGLAFIQAMNLEIALSSLAGPVFSEDVFRMVQDVLSTLVEETTPSVARTSQLPADLQATSSFVSTAVDFLIQGLGDPGVRVDIASSDDILTVISNVINTDNLPGSRLLMQTEPKNTFSNDLLSSTERYGLYLSTLLENSESNMTEKVLVRENILLNAMVVSVKTKVSDVVFPSDNVREMKASSNFSVLERIHDVSVVLPASLIQQRAINDNVDHVRVSNIIFQNLEQFLSSDINNNSGSQKPVSVILSSQVQQQSGDIDSVLTDPVTLTFTTLNQDKSQNFSCVFWDFSLFHGLGGWSVVGLNRGSVSTSGVDSVVQCLSNHLTSFAVLVNVGGGNLESKALSIVSYIGVGLSLVCLLASIIFFLSFGKKLFISVHNFVHLNLAISLFLAYLAFAVGIELATKDKIACQFVAALLQYLFLAVFFWMLCEGVMLYLMLVMVFSSLSKKWWFFLLLGWLPPIFFVVIGLASVPDQYGMYQNGKLKYCFLASGGGNYAIWAFAAPMLAVIIINTVLLALVLVSLVRSRGNKQEKVKKINEGKQLNIVLFAIKAAIILLPLLGLTWVIGFLAIGKGSQVFAWIFTILASLHGVLFFVLNVVRNDMIWGRFKRKYHLLESTKLPAQSTGPSYGNQYRMKNTNTSSTNTYSSLTTEKKPEKSPEFKVEADQKIPDVTADIKGKDDQV